MLTWSIILAAISIVGLWLAARVPVLGFAITLLAQPVWAIYAIVTQQFGFLLACVAYVVVYGRLIYTAREKQGYNERDKERLAIWVAAHLPVRVISHVLAPVQPSPTLVYYPAMEDE